VVKHRQAAPSFVPLSVPIITQTVLFGYEFLLHFSCLNTFSLRKPISGSPEGYRPAGWKKKRVAIRIEFVYKRDRQPGHLKNGPGRMPGAAILLKSPIFTWIEINLTAVEDNIKAVRAIAGVPVMAVVKANGYGHGAVEVSRAALAAGASWLAVSCAEEAIVLREAGITVPILVLGMVTAQEADEAIAAGLSLTVYCHESAELYSNRAKALGRSVNVHLKVDSGMGRLGTLPGEQTLVLARTIAGMPSVHLEGVFTHLACADEENPAPTNEQLLKFAATLQALQENGIRPAWIHAANSAATLAFPQARYNIVRVGVAIYGVHPSPQVRLPAAFRPALSWKARLVSCKVLPPGWGVSYGMEYHTAGEETVGVIPVGYADGWRRNRPNLVLLGGRRTPVIGRVCMDQCMIKLPEDASLGSEVVLVGRQNGEEIRVEEVAERWGTINYEVITGISARMPRVYVRNGETA
jgi:alanine racemase